MFVLKRICTPVCWVDFLLANGRPAVSDRFLQSQIHWPVIKKTSWIAYIFNRMCTSLFHIWFQFVLSPPLDVQSGLKTGSLWCGRSEIFFYLSMCISCTWVEDLNASSAGLNPRCKCVFLFPQKALLFHCCSLQKFSTYMPIPWSTLARSVYIAP